MTAGLRSPALAATCRRPDLLPHHLERLASLQRKHELRKEALYERTSPLRRILLDEIRQQRDALLESLLMNADLQDTGEPLSSVLAELRRYNTFCDWAALDLVALAVCTGATPRQIADALAPRLLIYHAFRLGDDVIDGHDDYKGGERTAFGNLRSRREIGTAAGPASIIMAFLMALFASRLLDREEQNLALRTLAGGLREAVPPRQCTLEEYRRIVDGKMISYSLLLHLPLVRLLPKLEGAELKPFLQVSFYLSQIANDLGDVEDDWLRHQPNYWNLREWPPSRAEEEFIAALFRISRDCDRFAGDLADYTHARVADLIRYTLKITGG